MDEGTTGDASEVYLSVNKVTSNNLQFLSIDRCLLLSYNLNSISGTS